MGKKAVVLCGGGAKGAYHIGAWKALNKLGFKPDIVTGTSVGALNGSLMVTGDYKTANDIWKSIDMNKVFSFKNKDISKAKSMNELIKLLIISGSNAEYEPLKKLIEDNVDENRVRNSKIDFGFVTTQFNPIKKIQMYKEDVPKGKLTDYILASAACYPYMKSYTINNKTFIDGGYFDNMPIEMAIKKGATDIVVVDLKAIGRNNKVNDLSAKITYVDSYHNLGDLLIFDKENSIKNIKLGYFDTMKAFNKLEGCKYTFKKGSNIKSSKYEDYMIDAYKKVFSNIPLITPFEKFAIKNIRECLEKYNKEIFKVNNNILLSLEFSASIFKIDPLKLYSFNSLTKEVLDRYKKISSHNEYKDILDLKTSINKVLEPNGLKKITDIYDKKNLLCYIIELLKNNTLNMKQKKEIWAFSIIMPDAVMGGMFISSYLNYKKLQFI